MVKAAIPTTLIALCSPALAQPLCVRVEAFPPAVEGDVASRWGVSADSAGWVTRRVGVSRVNDQVVVQLDGERVVDDRAQRAFINWRPGATTSSLRVGDMFLEEPPVAAGARRQWFTCCPGQWSEGGPLWHPGGGANTVSGYAADAWITRTIGSSGSSVIRCDTDYWSLPGCWPCGWCVDSVPPVLSADGRSLTGFTHHYETGTGNTAWLFPGGRVIGQTTTAPGYFSNLQGAVELIVAAGGYGDISTPMSATAPVLVHNTENFPHVAYVCSTTGAPTPLSSPRNLGWNTSTIVHHYGEPAEGDDPEGAALILALDEDGVVRKFVIPADSSGAVSGVAVPSMGSTRPMFVSQDGKFVIGERGEDWEETREVWVWTSALGSVRLADYLTDVYGYPLNGERFTDVCGMNAVGPVNSLSRARVISANMAREPHEQIPVPPLAIGADEIVVHGVDAEGRAQVWFMSLIRLSTSFSDLGADFANPSGGAWQDPENWENGVVPNDVQASARFNVGGTLEVTIEHTKRVSTVAVDAGEVRWGAAPAGQSATPGVLGTSDLTQIVSGGDVCEPQYTLAVGRESNSTVSLTLRGAPQGAIPPVPPSAGGLPAPVDLSWLLSVQTPYGVSVGTGTGSTASLIVGRGARLGTTLLAERTANWRLEQLLGDTGLGAVKPIRLGDGVESDSTLEIEAEGGVIAAGIAAGIAPGSRSSLRVAGSLIAGYAEDVMSDHCPQVGWITLGQRGEATMTVANGAVVRTASLTLGAGSGSSGRLTLDGAAQSVLVGDTVIVGDDGRGTLELRNGGAIELARNQRAIAGFAVARGDGGDGELIVDRSQVQLHKSELVIPEGTTGQLITIVSIGAGDESTANVNVANGGALLEAYSVSLFAGVGSSGTVTVSGRHPVSQAPSTISFSVENGTASTGFENGTGLRAAGGVLRISDGGQVIGPSGVKLTSDALIDVSGGLLRVPKTIVVDGHDADDPQTLARMIVQNAGRVECGALAISEGDLRVLGAGSRVVIEGDLVVASRPKGSPTRVVVSGGASVRCGTLKKQPGTIVNGQITVGSARGVDPPEGISTDVLLMGQGDTIDPAQVTLYPNGGIGGNGAWAGDFTNQSIVRVAYDPTVGTDGGFDWFPLSVLGNYTQAPGAVLEVPALTGDSFSGGLLSAGSIRVSGTAQLSGSVVVRSFRGMHFIDGMEATIVDATGGFTGRFDGISGPELPDGRSWGLRYDEGAGRVYLTIGPACPADFNDDGVVNSTDVSDFVNQWFQDQVAGTLDTDWDGNGVVNSTDVSGFINSWFEDTAAGCG